MPPYFEELRRVLYIEPDLDLQEVIAIALSSFAKVIPAATAAQARVHLANDDYDLVVLELSLPDGNGLDMLSEVKATSNGRRRAPVVLLFSADDPAAQEAAQVDLVLVKTRVGLEQVVEAVRRLVVPTEKFLANSIRL